MAMLPLKNKVQETFCDRQKTSTGFGRITARKSGFGATAWAPGAKIRRMQQTCPVYMQNTPLVIQTHPCLSPTYVELSVETPTVSVSLTVVRLLCSLTRRLTGYHGVGHGCGLGSSLPSRPPASLKGAMVRVSDYEKNWIKMSLKTSKFGTSNSKRLSTD